MGCLSILVGLILGGVALVRYLYPPLWRDLKTLRVVLIFLRRLMKAYKQRIFVIDRFEQHARNTPDKEFILYKEESYTYQQGDELATKMARALMAQGVSRDDTVALVMSNEPAFMWIYLGTQKIGARLSMINHYLMAEGLQRSIDACNPKIVIVGDGLADYLPSRIADIKSSLQTEAPIFSFNPPKDGATFPCFSHLVDEASSEAIDPSVRSEVKLTDTSAYIYTSGTTGFPKPAIITHKKAIKCSLAYGPVGFACSDVMYMVLPLYHASAINLSILNVIQEGATMVLREKFSASHFWKDCVRYKVTIVQYIGELFRYLTNSPECPEESRHQIWAVAGNGLRPDVWPQVRDRFQIKNIFEFYGSTEMPAGITNYFGVEGSVGRLSPLLSAISGCFLVDLDETTQQPYRDANGRCRVTKPGGYGVLLNRLNQKVTFDGYLGPESATTSKVIKDVLKKGDTYVNCSDLFTMDKDYNVYFKDRLGDTFRWKGENVSTMEVSSIINTADFVQDANVYGVTVPGCEGKAGMAAITLKDGQTLSDEKLDQLGQLCHDKLPPYARPRFLRFQRQMSLNSTFKQLKVDLVKEGFDVDKVKDEPIFYLDRKSDTFHPLDSSRQGEIVTGQLPL